MRPAATVVLLLAGSLAAQDTSTRNEIQSAVASLFSAARSGDRAACVKAADALVALGEPAVPELGKGLGARSEKEAVWGLRCLREIGGDSAAEAVLALVDHASPDVRAEALSCGRTLGSEAFIPAMLRAVRSEHRDERRRAYDGLLALAPGEPSTLEPALEGLGDPDFWVRTRALRLIAALPQPKEDTEDEQDAPDPLLEGLRRVLADMRGETPTSLFRQLVKRYGKRLEPLVEAGLKVTTPETLLGALEAVRALRMRESLPRVRELAEEGTEPVRLAAIRTLAALRDREEEALRTLISVLERARSKSLRNAAATTLRQLTGELHGYDVAAWRRYVRGLDS